MFGLKDSMKRAQNPFFLLLFILFFVLTPRKPFDISRIFWEAKQNSSPSNLLSDGQLSLLVYFSRQRIKSDFPDLKKKYFTF